MSDARYDVMFRGTMPAVLAIGDKLEIHGTVTVRAIAGDLVDISGHGAKEYAVGDMKVDLYANELEVKLA